MAALRWLRRSVWILLTLFFMATTIASFASSAFVVAVSAAVHAATGLSTAPRALAASGAAARGAVVQRMRARLSRAALRSAGAAAVQSAPYVGAAAVIAVTALELADYCALAEDLDALDGDEAAGTVCGVATPSAPQACAAAGLPVEWCATLSAGSAASR
jgi:hypothetical protein